LVAASALARLREQSVQVAQRVLTDNKARVEAGKMTEIEVLQAESGLAVRRAFATEAAQKIDAAMALLNAFFGRPGGIDQPVILPSDELSPAPLAGDTGAALADAFKLHPLYLAQYEKNKQDDIRLAYAKNQRWPQVDLKASYGLNGLGSDFGTSWDSIHTTDFPSWYVGVELRVPLAGGKKGRSQARVAQLRKEQGLLELKAIEVELTSVVSSLIRRVTATQQKSQSFQEVVALNQRLLDTDLTRLDSGKSDSRKVLQTEQDLADARANELEARIEWQRAEVELLVQTGTYLGKRGHELQ
jgi:outer membrane protein TolC